MYVWPHKQKDILDYKAKYPYNNISNNIQYRIRFYLLEMGFGPLGTPCSLSLSIFPFRHVVIGRRTLKLSLLLPSGEVTATSLTCEASRWVWSMVLWWVWRIREKKTKRTSETMMWGDRITCYISIRLWADITRRTHTKQKRVYSGYTELLSSWKIKKWVFLLVERDVWDCFVEMFFLWCINAWKVQEENKENKRKSKDGTNFFTLSVCECELWGLIESWDWKIKGVTVFLNMTSLLYKRLDVNFFLKIFITKIKTKDIYNLHKL